MENVKGQSDDPKDRTDLRLRAYRFSVALVKFLRSLPANRVNNPLIDQLIRSGTSIGANIVEAKAASSRKEFSRFYDIALKSANETKYWLCLMRDGLDVDGARIMPLLNEAKELSNILAASLLTLRAKQ